MVSPLRPPPKKNPLQRTQRTSPLPLQRSRTSHGLTQAAAEGRFCLQHCMECGAYSYPPREACSRCLSSALRFKEAPRHGNLLSETTVRVASENYYRERAPWRIGLIQLDCGPTMVAHLHADCVEGGRVVMSLQLDKNGQAAAFASPDREVVNMLDDRQWREFAADPKFRRALVTNGRSAAGREVARALKEAGASIVYVGLSAPWMPFPEREQIQTDDCVRIVEFDPADEKSTKDLAADIGGKIDILVNTCEFIRPGGILGRASNSFARDDLDRSYFAFLHLAQSFGPAMRMRGSDGVNSAAAWVNLLSVYALMNAPEFGLYSATQAALLSLSQCLRAELRPGGVKVVNVFTGPTETEWFQTVPPPKVAPRAIASAIVKALKQGMEDVFVGDVAEDLRARFIANPKGLERELAL